MTLYCSICLHVREGVAPEADTVINGHAVCYDHMGYVQGDPWTSAMALAAKAMALAAENEKRKRERG